MWWPDTWEQSVDQLKRYDWIGFGDWDNISAIRTLKTLNPDQKHFMDFSITETSWSWWQNEKKTVMEKIPAEWFLTQRGTSLAHSPCRGFPVWNADRIAFEAMRKTWPVRTRA